MDNIMESTVMADYKKYLQKKVTKRILIYGAGVVAYYFSYELMENKVFRQAFDGFIVQRPEYDVSNYWGKPVQSISKYDEDKDKYYLIIATKDNVWDEIDIYLKEHGWRDYYFLSSEEYMQIRRKYSQPMEEYMIGQFERIRTRLGQMEGTINRIYSNMVDMTNIMADVMEKYQYNGKPSDKTNYLDDFREFRSKDTYIEEVQGLLEDLSVESMQKVCLILDRLNRLCDNQPILYSEDEEKQLEVIESEFYRKICKISDSLYMYKDYKLPIYHFETCVFWYEHGIGMLENLDCIKNKCLIDAGGFIGDSALVFSKYWTGKIYSFEADADNYSYMQDTISLNELKNVIPVNKALVDREGAVDIYKTLANSCNTINKKSSFSEIQGNPVQVQGISLDTFVEERQLSVGLIKTDVEGAEQCLLEGAEKTLKKQKPDLIISIYHSIEDFFHIKRKIENLDVGYRFKLFRPVIKGSFMLETCLICEAILNNEA